LNTSIYGEYVQDASYKCSIAYAVLLRLLYMDSNSKGLTRTQTGISMNFSKRILINDIMCETNQFFPQGNFY